MMQPLDFNFQAIMETDVSDVENINPRKTPGQDSSIVPILLKKKRPLLSVAPSLGLYSTTVQLRASGLRNGKWGNGHLHSKRETNGPKKTIDRLQYSHYMGTQVFEHLLCKQITMYQDRILYPRMTAYEEAEGRLQSQT